MKISIFLFFLLLLLPAAAYAQVAGGDITTITINMDAIGKVAGTVIIALGGMWGLRKTIKIINRS